MFIKVVIFDDLFVILYGVMDMKCEADIVAQR